MASNLYKPTKPDNFYNLDIENVCRVCLQSDVSLSSIFKDEIDDMVSDFLPSKAVASDGFPPLMCFKCIEDVKIAYAFKKQSAYAHELIKKMLEGKRLPRSSSKKNKSYQEVGEHKIYRHVALPGDKDMYSYKCYICQRKLSRKDVLRKHLERVHHNYDFDIQYPHLVDANKIMSMDSSKINGNMEEVTLEMHPNLIMLDENDLNNSDSEDIFDSEEPNASKEQNSEIIDITEDDVHNSTPIIPSQHNYDCHICNKKLTRRYYLKCHLERVHQFYDIDVIKPKMMPVKIKMDNLEKPKKNISPMQKATTTTVMNNTKQKHSPKQDLKIEESETTMHDNSKSEIFSFECHICFKQLTRKYGLKRHYEQVHKLTDFEISIDEAGTVEDEPIKDVEMEEPVIAYVTPPSPPPPPAPAPGRSIKMISVYVCHLCDKEFSGRATMRRHLKNIHKFFDFENSIWLSKVQQKAPFDEQEENQNIVEVEDNNYDMSYDQDEDDDNDDVDMHAFLCPEVVITTNEDIPDVSEEEKIDPKPMNSDMKLEIMKTEEPREPPKRNSDGKFVCGICTKGFNRADHLRRHEMTHSDLKPFSCSLCGRSFNRPDILQKHQMSVHFGPKV